jgi:group I intron endonuclease
MIDVYLHRAPNGKGYVGISARGMHERWRGHLRSAGKGSRLLFHAAIRKYGADAFTHELLERMSTEAGAKRAEQLWIAALSTFAPSGYNLTLGGEGPSGFTDRRMHARGMCDGCYLRWRRERGRR